MSGSGGGGGGSGSVNYPFYMRQFHTWQLDNNNTDFPRYNVVEVQNQLFDNSPWTAYTAYDPDSDISAWEGEIANFFALISGIADEGNWADFYDQAETSIPDAADIDLSDVNGITDAEIDNDIDAFSDQLSNDLTTKALPRFRRGMQDINAVVSSAFPIGEAVLEAFRLTEVARHGSSIRLTAAGKNADIELGKANIRVENEKLKTQVKFFRVQASELMLRLLIDRIGWNEAYMKTFIEANRIKIVAKKEENAVNMKIDEEDALWNIELFQYGANVLASIGGGVSNPKIKEPSAVQSAIGGALSGAAAGGQITGGNAYGYAIGAVLGAASALL